MEPSSEVLRWLARAMVVARKRAHLDQIDIAYHARVKEGTVERWERGEHWPRGLDSALAAYAKAADLNGALAMWDLALRLWRDHDERAMRPENPADVVDEELQLVDELRQQSAVSGGARDPTDPEA